MLKISYLIFHNISVILLIHTHDIEQMNETVFIFPLKTGYKYTVDI